MPQFCNPEFGCDCLDEIRALEAEVEILRLRLQVNTGIAVRLMEGWDEHKSCSGPTCTEECMRMTI